MYVSCVLTKLGKDFWLKVDSHVGCTSRGVLNDLYMYTVILDARHSEYRLHWWVALQQMDPRVEKLPKDQPKIKHNNECVVGKGVSRS